LLIERCDAKRRNHRLFLTGFVAFTVSTAALSGAGNLRPQTQIGFYYGNVSIQSHSISE
jgi:hypothetical protein